MRHIYSTCFLTAILFLAGVSAFAQETQERVVDEVVAQVNEGVITLSRIRRESKAIVDGEVQQGKTREAAQKIVDEKQGELIANLINEELIVQKAKELGLDKEVEESVNLRFTQIMKQYNMRTLDALYQEMEKTGVNAQEIREVWRKQAIRDMVLQKEVQSKQYWRPSGKELKEYFEKNKAKFTKPETVTLSEIFLKFAGLDENAVREKAKQLVAQLRSGSDFVKAVSENSDADDKAQSKGSLGSIGVKDLGEKFATYSKAIEGVKIGGVTEPFEDEIGVHILRVDERSQASNESFYDENAVRMAILTEKAPAAQKEFMATLRQDSYIKISETYRPLVAPILFAEERKEKTANK